MGAAVQLHSLWNAIDKCHRNPGHDGASIVNAAPVAHRITVTAVNIPSIDIGKIHFPP